MFNKPTLRKLYAAYKFLLFLITFIVFVHTKNKMFAYYSAVFFAYLLDAALFVSIENRYFTALSFAVDMAFAYFVARLLSIEEMVIFSVVPLFFSCLLIDCILSLMLLGVSFLVLFFYSDLNIIFTVISYMAAFLSSYLARQALFQRELIAKKEAFDKEFKDKIFIAKRMSLEFAHEIRNPLMGISGAIEILKKTKDEKTKDEMLDIAQQEIERANNLTKDFLNLETPYKLNKKQFELCAFLRKFSSQNRGLIQIEIGCATETVDINADQDMIRRMLSNFIRNSIEAKANHIHITLSSTDTKVVLIIEDDGEGINIKDEDKDKIFLPFFTTKAQGSGLGLAICKQIAEAHKGRIGIYGSNAFKIELNRR